LPNKIEQSLWVQKLSAKLQVREDAIIEELKKIKLENNNQPVEQVVTRRDANSFTSEGRKKLLQERIVSLILKDPNSFCSIKDTDCHLFIEKIKNFLENLKKASDPIFASEDAEAETKLKATLALRGELELENEGSEEVELCLSQLKDIELRNQLEKLSLAIGGESDIENTEKLKKEFDIKAKELHFKTEK
jgi:hypothetical protein